ncbi:MAG: hypothetical protein IT204_19715 [Fimbriimonadaceae bacterium]|nr:hypothetical protein [Fimbriimonadaceae bacterium]
MQLTLLGSAAAEAWPAIFCCCEVCVEARRRGGRNLRRRTAYAVNHDTLVDFGPDSHWQCHEFAVDLTAVQRILFTHSHSDHLTPPELYWRHRGFSQVAGPLAIYGNQQVLDRIAGESGANWEALSLQPHLLHAGEAVASGDYEVLPVEANHAGAEEQALNYVLRQGGRGLLIGNDTGWWPEASWDLLRGAQLDAAVIECTYGLGYPDRRNGHLGAAAALEFRDRLVALGALQATAQVVVNHFTHNGAGLYEELVAWFEPRGAVVGYDGLSLLV